MDSVLVVGGGITGIQTSLDLSQLGCTVTLLEKEEELGGKLNNSLHFHQKRMHLS